MVKVRQILEYMVRCAAEGACVAEGDLSNTISQLYGGQWINEATKGNYHTTRILENKAVRKGDDTTYDANQTFQLLIQEVCVFVNEFAGSSSGRPVRMFSTAKNTSEHPAPRQGTGEGRSASGKNSQRVPARNTHSGPSRQNGPGKKHGRVSPAAYVLKLLIPVLLVIFLTVVIRASTSDRGKDADKATIVPTVTTAPVESTFTLPLESETEPETEPPAEAYRVRGSSASARSESSISGRILIRLGSGTEVMHVKRYDNDWVVINYGDREAYVSSKYIEEVEPIAPTRGETEGSGARTAS